MANLNYLIGLGNNYNNMCFSLQCKSDLKNVVIRILLPSLSSGFLNAQNL